MQLYFQPDLRQAEGALSAEESNHLAKVLRARVGQHILITDGNGSCGTAELTVVDRSSCRYRIVTGSIDKTDSLPLIHLAITPLQHPDRMEWLLEKAVEIGVGSIQLIKTSRSSHPRVKADRAQRIMLAAMKQSQRWHLPESLPEISIHEFLKKNRKDVILVAHCIDAEKTFLGDMTMDVGRIWLMIGPEGDFTTEEVKMCLDAGAKPISLGKARLRSETAAIFGLSVLNSLI